MNNTTKLITRTVILLQESTAMDNDSGFSTLAPYLAIGICCLSGTMLYLQNSLANEHNDSNFNSIPLHILRDRTPDLPIQDRNNQNQEILVNPFPAVVC